MTQEFKDKKEEIQREILNLKTAKVELDAAKSREGVSLRKVMEDFDRRTKEIQQNRKEMYELMTQDFGLVGTHKREINENLKSLDTKIGFINEKIRKEFTMLGSQ